MREGVAVTESSRGSPLEPVQQPESEKNLIQFFQIFVTRRDSPRDFVDSVAAGRQL